MRYLRPLNFIIFLVASSLPLSNSGAVDLQRPHDDAGENSGLLDLEQLIQLAIQNNPKLAELRGELNVALARERSAKDLEDPEIRASFSRDNDVELPPTETETRRTTTKRSGSKSAQGTESRTDKEGSNIKSESRNSDSNEDFDEISTTRTTRTTTRGARGETVREETWESTTESTSGSDTIGIIERDGGKTNQLTRVETANSRSNERLVDRTLENRLFNSDITTPDEDFSVKLRLRVPNPFERKAAIAKARARIGLATAILNSAEHEVALAVRKAYTDAAAAHAKLVAARNTSDVHSRLADELDKLGTWAKPEDEISAQSDSFRSSLELPVFELDFQRQLAQLAMFVGLSDPKRISMDSKIAPTRIDLTDLDPEFLYQVAEGYRGDILALVHKLKVSEYDLAEYNARKVPWFTFVEGFYGVEKDQGYRSSDNYGIQFGMSLPLFSWFKNKGHEVIEQEQQSLQVQAGLVRSKIRSEVDTALAQVKHATALMSKFESSRKNYREIMTRSRDEAQQGGLQANDSRFRAEDSLARLEELTPEIHKSYNEAILMLERALGTSLKEVFSNSDRPSPPVDGSLESGPVLAAPDASSSPVKGSFIFGGRPEVIRGGNKPPHRKR